MLYLPRASDGPNCDSIASPGRPLVLIYHALGVEYGDYRELGLRLASHGFVVASLEHSTRLDEAIDFIDSEIGAFLTDDVVLIGHSAGGDLMIQRRAQPAEAGRKVQAMVLMAPRVDSSLFPNYALSGVSAFLGLHWVRDNDPATWGAPVLGNGGLRRSVFRIYDRAGVDFMNPEALALFKHFVFFDYGGHENQNLSGVLAYTTSFLRRHVYGDLGQDQHLKLMSPPAQLAQADHPVSQQHEEPDRVLLASFEEGGAQANPAAFDGLAREGVSFDASPSGIVFAASDPFSPHDLGVLRFNFEPRTAAEHSVTVLLDGSVPIDGMNYLSFRITQEYHPETSSAGGTVDFDIVVHSEGAEHRVSSEDYQRLTFPVVAPAVVLTQTSQVVDATKNAMRTYLIPLDDFGLADPGSVQAVTFDFTDSGERPGQRVFMTMDQVQLTQ